MKKMKKAHLIYMALIILFASCQDIIDIDLNEIDPKIVIEGSVVSGENVKVTVSYTTDYYNPTDFPGISGAVVTVSDGEGSSEILKETETVGLYESSEIVCEYGKTYELKVEHEGEEYTATSEMPKEVEEWFPLFTEMEFTFGDSTMTMMRMLCLLPDVQEDTTNYFRLKTYKLHDEQKGNGSFNIFDDTDVIEDEFLGELIMLGIPTDFQLFDSVIVEVISINKKTYDFYNSLTAIAGSSDGGGPPPTSTPANPMTNISNGGFGYFSSYAISIDTLVVFEMPMGENK